MKWIINSSDEFNLSDFFLSAHCDRFKVLTSLHFIRHNLLIIYVRISFWPVRHMIARHEIRSLNLIWCLKRNHFFLTLNSTDYCTKIRTGLKITSVFTTRHTLSKLFTCIHFFIYMYIFRNDFSKPQIEGTKTRCNAWGIVSPRMTVFCHGFWAGSENIFALMLYSLRLNEVDRLYCILQISCVLYSGETIGTNVM